MLKMSNLSNLLYSLIYSNPTINSLQLKTTTNIKKHQQR
jgi:hypothetical protein